MISKAKIKYIHSLELKKNRKAERVFVAEGPKVVADLMEMITPRVIVATEQWLSNFSCSLSSSTEIITVTDEELRKVSFLQHPQHVLAVFPQPDATNDATINPNDELILALDGVQDPGNLGTIIRIADWFGITHIVCSMESADVWNPKVVQATMGSIARVRVIYRPLTEFLSNLPADTPVYGTFLDGDDIHNAELYNRGVVIMGNEGNGISEDVARFVTQRILIPNYPTGRSTADSLNVAIATAITCYELRRP